MEIKNNNLKIFLQTVLNKPIEQVTENDLTNITRVSFMSEVDNSSNIRVNFNDLTLFPNLKELTISDTYISISDLDTIKKYNGIEKIFFNRCMFEKGTFPLSSNVSELELVGCYLEDYSFLQNINCLKKLVISNPYTENVINLSYLSNLSELKVLVLDRCILDNFNNLLNLNKLEFLSLLWTVLPNNYSDIFNNMASLNKLYISDGYDKSFIKDLVDVKNNLNEFVFDIDTESTGRKQ